MTGKKNVAGSHKSQIESRSARCSDGPGWLEDDANTLDEESSIGSTRPRVLIYTGPHSVLSPPRGPPPTLTLATESLGLREEADAGGSTVHLCHPLSWCSSTHNP